MQGPKPHPADQSTWLKPDTHESSNTAGLTASTTNEAVDLDRLAKFVADGQLPLPSHLEGSTQQQVLRRVAQFRRSRLLNFIARVIAQDIYRLRDS